MRGVRLGGLLLAAAMLLSGLRAGADVVMHMELERKTYLCFEPVVAVVTLRNTSGQVLIFGSEPEFKGHMEIELTDFAGRPLSGSGTRFELKGLMLRAGADQRIRVNLSGKVDLSQSGGYRVRLILSHPMLRDDYESNRCAFEVSAGRIYWQRRFGVPKLTGENDAGSPAALRDYTIRLLLDGSRLYYYLLVEDEKNIYAMKRIGMAVNRDRPHCEIDMLNRLHVLLPLQSKVYQHQVFDWTGNRELNRVYKSSGNVPFLFRDAATGEVKVLGGELASLGVDYEEDRLLPGEPASGDRADKEPPRAAAPGAKR